MKLAQREEQCARLICDGLQNKEIAVRMNISEHTVKRTREHVYEKLGVHNTAELVRKMLQPA